MVDKWQTRRRCTKKHHVIMTIRRGAVRLRLRTWWIRGGTGATRFMLC